MSATQSDNADARSAPAGGNIAADETAPSSMPETMMDLVAINRLRMHPVWEADMLASKRLAVLRRHFHTIGFFVHRDAQEREQSRGWVSEQSKRAATSLNILFAELETHEARETSRLLWDRLRASEEQNSVLCGISLRLKAMTDDYTRIVYEEMGSISKNRAEGTRSWDVTFATAESVDLAYLRELQNQISDVIVVLDQDQLIEQMNAGQLERLLESRKPRKPRFDGKIIFIANAPMAKGGYGTVHKGIREGQIIAAKRLVPFTREAHRLLPRLAREFLSMRELAHPNILPLISLSVGMDPKDSSFLIFPWASQGNARSFVKGKTFVERLRVISQALNGLAYLHEHDVVHGDLKAANILIGDNDTVLLGDFGLSTSVSLNFPGTYKVQGYVNMAGLVTLPDQYWDALGEETPVEISNRLADLYDSDEGSDDHDTDGLGGSDGLTLLARGTRGWSAPEVMEGVPSAVMQHMPMSDIYALGRTVYELMTDRNPSEGPYLIRPKECVTGDSFYDTLWDLIQRCTIPDIIARASLLEIHLRLDDVWLEHASDLAFEPARSDVTRANWLLQRCLKRPGRPETSLAWKVLDEARYWSSVVVRAVDSAWTHSPVITSPPLRQGKLQRLRSIHVIASDTDLAAKGDVIDFSHLDYNASEYVELYVIRAQDGHREPGRPLINFLVRTDVIDHVRGFPRKLYTYEIDPFTLKLREGDTIKIKGRYRGKEARVIQMHLFFGVPLV